MAATSLLAIFWHRRRDGGVPGPTVTKPMNLSPPQVPSVKGEPARTSTESATRVPQIGYIVKMFPRLSETFIRNEILELERHGLHLKIFSLKRPAEPAIADNSVRAHVTYLPDHLW